MHRRRAFGFSVAVILCLGLSTTFSPGAARGLLQTGTPVSGTPSAPRSASPVASVSASPAASPVAEVGGGAGVVFAADEWRLAIVSAARQPGFPELGLGAKAGRDWIVAVVDAANWSDAKATLKPKEFGIRVTGTSGARGFNQKLSESAAAMLSLEPKSVDAGVAVEANAMTRAVLVFRVDSTAVDPALVYNNDAVGLASSLARSGSSFSALPAASPLPALTAQKVTAVDDGSSITLASGVVRLAGVDAPAPAECFGGKSIARLKKLAGDRVLVEPDPADPGAAFIWTQPGKGARVLLNHALIADGYAAASSGLKGGYAPWLGDAGTAAKTSLAGLWAACTNQHGVARAQGPEATGLTLTSTGAERPYAPWIAWSPWIVTTPDGGAWAFFSADATKGKDTGKKRLYSSRFEPATGGWTPATAMAGGEIQMGPSTAVDAKGVVHLVFTDRAKDQDGIYTVLMYTHEDGAGGWVTPTPVAPDPQAGFQLSPSLAIDKNGTLHAVWQDQRGFAADARISSPANADIFTSELPPGGAWTPPVVVNKHFNDAVSSRPHIVADGDRLVAVWSVYAAALGLDFAARIDWNSRPLDDPNGWGTSQGLIVGRGEKFGGRLLDLAADPTGGAVLVFGRQANDTFLFMRRLEAESSTWGGDVLITYGDRGTFPSLAMAANGTAYVTYNVGTGSIVKVGAVSVSFRSIQPGPEVNLTEKEKGAQGRPIITVDDTGHPWVVYFVDPGTGVANQVQILRNAEIPTESPAK